MPTFRHMAPVAFGLVAVLTATDVRAQGSQGENYSAGKTPAQLFNSDCTGTGCHRGPQGLSKGRSSGSLSGFLREHYTNSRESAAALAGYLLGVPGTGDSREVRPGAPASGAPSRPAAVRRDDNAKPSNEPGASTPAPPRPTLRQPPKTDDAAKPTEAPAANVSSKPAAARSQQRPPVTAAAPPPPAASPPAPPPAAPREEIFD